MSFRVESETFQRNKTVKEASKEMKTTSQEVAILNDRETLGREW